MAAVAHGPDGPPGGYYYSNANYVILGMIAQAITGEPINELISTRILRPLHLSHTFFPLTTAPRSLVHGYVTEGVKGFGQRVVDVTKETMTPAMISFVGAAGAMISTLGDLEVWAKAFATGRLLSASMRREQLEITERSPQYGVFSSLPTTTPAVLPASYGLGVLDVGGWLGKDGLVAGYSSAMFYQLSSGATIVVLVNGWKSQVASIADDVPVNFAHILLGGH